MTSELSSYLKHQQERVDQALLQRLPSAATAPETLHKAMRYSMMAGGKRLRPILCLAAAEACGAHDEVALPLACSVECLHTYSLIHDDLPSMDNDDLRRGEPTCHVVFGEGIAVLTGDALQALAFELVSEAQTTGRYDMRAFLRELAHTAGSLQLIAGQVLDVEGEGKQLSKEALLGIHLRKTAALLKTSLRFGAMSANASQDQLDAITRFGEALGLAFQVIDDILDVTQTSERLGKSAGKDQASEKATYPALLGLEASRQEASRLTEEANRALTLFGPQAARLQQIADYMLKRDY